MRDREVIVSTTIIVIAIFLVIGLTATLVQGKEYYENTANLSPGEQISQEIELLGGDTVRVIMNIEENASARLLVKKDQNVKYNVTASDMDLTIATPTSAKTVSYDFIIRNLTQDQFEVTYLYEVTLVHNFWMGVMWLVLAAILGVALFFALMTK